MSVSMRTYGTRVMPLALALSAAASAAAAAKCPPVLMPALPGGEPETVVWLVDGVIPPTVTLTDEEIEARTTVDLQGRRMGPMRVQLISAPDAADVHDVRIVCWNPQTGRIQPGPGVQVIDVITVGLVASTRAPLEALVAAQDAYLAEHSRYATDLADLVRFGLPRDAELDFTSTDGGWSARTPAGDISYRCAVHVGDATAGEAGSAGDVTCERDDANANRAMSERYAAGL
jgi:hypothetical protein